MILKIVGGFAPISLNPIFSRKKLLGVSQIKSLYLTLLSDSFLGGRFTCDSKIFWGLRPQRVLRTFLYCQIRSLVDDFLTILKILGDSPERVYTLLYSQIHSLLADLLAIYKFFGGSAPKLCKPSSIIRLVP